jgi:hypothetical protein
VSVGEARTPGSLALKRPRTPARPNSPQIYSSPGDGHRPIPEPSCSAPQAPAPTLGRVAAQQGTPRLFAWTAAFQGQLSHLSSVTELLVTYQTWEVGGQRGPMSSPGSLLESQAGGSGFAVGAPRFLPGGQCPPYNGRRGPGRDMGQWHPALGNCSPFPAPVPASQRVVVK